MKSLFIDKYKITFSSWLQQVCAHHQSRGLVMEENQKAISSNLLTINYNVLFKKGFLESERKREGIRW